MHTHTCIHVHTHTHTCTQTHTHTHRHTHTHTHADTHTHTRTHTHTEIPQLLQCPGTHIEVNADHKLQLTVLATVPSGAHLSYQWFRDSKLLEFGTGPELLVPHAHITDGGNYNCRVTSDLGGSILTSNCQVTGM